MFKFWNFLCFVLFCLLGSPVLSQSVRQEFVDFCKTKHRLLAGGYRSVEFFELRVETSSSSWRHSTHDNNCSVEMIWPNAVKGGTSTNGKDARLTNIAICNNDYLAYLGSIESTRTESTPRNPFGVSWQIQMFDESPPISDCVLKYCFTLPRCGMTYFDLASDKKTDVESWIVDREAKTGTVKLRSKIVPNVNGEAEVVAVFDLESGACLEMTVSGLAPEGFAEKTATIRHKFEYSQLSPVPIIQSVNEFPNFGTPTKSEISGVDFEPDVNHQVFRLPFYGINERNFVKKSWLAGWWIWIVVISTMVILTLCYVYRKSF